MKFVRHLIVRFWSKSHKLSDYISSVVYFYCALLFFIPISTIQITGTCHDVHYSFVQQYQIKLTIIWDACKGHICESVRVRAEQLKIVTAGVPKNLTHLLFPLDLTANRSIKQMEQEESLSDWT
jgi:hypothetical protein